MSVVKDVDLEAMPMTIFLNDDDEDDDDDNDERIRQICTERISIRTHL